MKMLLIKKAIWLKVTMMRKKKLSPKNNKMRKKLRMRTYQWLKMINKKTIKRRRDKKITLKI